MEYMCDFEYEFLHIDSGANTAFCGAQFSNILGVSYCFDQPLPRCFLIKLIPQSPIFYILSKVFIRWGPDIRGGLNYVINKVYSNHAPAINKTQTQMKMVKRNCKITLNLILIF